MSNGEGLERRRAVATDRVARYERMVEIRAFEDRVQGLFAEGLVHGTTHTAQGQEAVAVGIAAAARPTDLVTCTYRGHGVGLALGMTPEVILGEIMGREIGCIGGNRRLYASLRPGAGPSTHLRHYRGRHTGCGRSGAHGSGAGNRRRGDWSVRRRGFQHRRLPRGPEPGGYLEAAGGVHMREQPVRGVQPDRSDHSHRRSGRPGRLLRHSGDHRGRTGPRPDRRGGGSGFGHRALGRGTHPLGDEDLPLRGAFSGGSRPSTVPRGSSRVGTNGIPSTLSGRGWNPRDCWPREAPTR